MVQESDVFVAPEPLWGAGAGGDDSRTLSNGAWSANNSLGTPQSHFKATLGRKRSRGVQQILSALIANERDVI